MAEWRTPVFDRTMDDVKSVDRTSATCQKGALNADDLNRIEDNYKYLMAKLRSDAIFIPHRLRNYAETVIKAVESEVSTSKLPEGYTQVEYIESSGTQYIDTGFKANQNTRLKLKFAYTSGDVVFGAYNSGGKGGFALQAVSSKWYTYHGSSNGNSSTAVTTGTVMEIDMNKNVTSLNGNVIRTASANTFSGDYPIFLSALNNMGNGASNFTVIKTYSCQIWDNGTLVRNFIPCTNASGTAGLYDIANDKFYANAGTGTFTAGEEVETETETVITYEEITTIYTDWQEQNVPWLSEIARIRANYNALVRLFLVGLGLPVLAESNYLDYVEVNEWERIALVGKKMFENMELEYRYCGMEDSGGERLL